MNSGPTPLTVALTPLAGSLRGPARAVVQELDRAGAGLDEGSGEIGGVLRVE